MASPTREEAETLFTEVSAAWDANDAVLVSEHLVFPMSELAEFSVHFGRPVSLEAVFPIDERRALLVTRSSHGGLVAYELVRGRDSRLRIDLGAMIGDWRDTSASIESFAAQAARMVEPPREKRPRKKKPKKSKWRPTDRRRRARAPHGFRVRRTCPRSPRAFRHRA